MPASRRDILTMSAAAGMGAFATRAGAATFGNPDEPAQGIVNTQDNPRGAVDPGPQNRPLTGQFPMAFTPPSTDVGVTCHPTDRLLALFFLRKKSRLAVVSSVTCG